MRAPSKGLSSNDHVGSNHNSTTSKDTTAQTVSRPSSGSRVVQFTGDIDKDRGVVRSSSSNSAAAQAPSSMPSAECNLSTTQPPTAAPNSRFCFGQDRASSTCAARPGQRLLCLDGNPLGYSGVRCIMQALAGVAAVAAVQPPGAIACTAAGLDTPVTVTILNCRVMAQQKGFRASLSDSKPASVFLSPVPLLTDAVQLPATKPKAAGQAIPTPNVNPAALGGGKGSVNAPPVVGPMHVVTEKASGIDFTSPAGQYSLSLGHPASGLIIEQLVDLRARLQQLQQQQKDKASGTKAAPPAPTQPTAIDNRGSGNQRTSGQSSAAAESAGRAEGVTAAGSSSSSTVLHTTASQSGESVVLLQKSRTSSTVTLRGDTCESACYNMHISLHVSSQQVHVMYGFKTARGGYVLDEAN